jgi:ABC-type amino acid transport system permease subunit
MMPGFTLETILAVVLCLIFSFGCSCMALSRDVKKPRLDWVTEQEAVKQNFGVLVSMLVSWAVLAALAILGYFMLSSGWTILPVFVVLLAVLLGLSAGAYALLMRNVNRYYCV